MLYLDGAYAVVGRHPCQARDKLSCCCLACSIPRCRVYEQRARPHETRAPQCALQHGANVDIYRSFSSQGTTWTRSSLSTWAQRKPAGACEPIDQVRDVSRRPEAASHTAERSASETARLRYGAHATWRNWQYGCGAATHLDHVPDVLRVHSSRVEGERVLQRALQQLRKFGPRPEPHHRHRPRRIAHVLRRQACTTPGALRSHHRLALRRLAGIVVPGTHVLVLVNHLPHTRCTSRPRCSTTRCRRDGGPHARAATWGLRRRVARDACISTLPASESDRQTHTTLHGQKVKHAVVHVDTAQPQQRQQR